jgi:4,5-dihydroxyphthalate decarboxylase
VSKLAINVVTKNYDHLAPLACGDVVAEGIDLSLDRKTSMIQFLLDPTFHAGEMSFSQYLIRLSQGERDFVGMPVFPTRAFRHRCFFVLRDSGLEEFKDLEGKRVGTNAWPDTGNTWSRAALREQGVQIDQIDWWVGPIDDPSYDSFGHRPKLTLPSNVQPTAPGQTIRDMLLDGELDALMCPIPPKGFYDPDSPIARLFPDYRQVEQAYARRVNYFPAHHIIAMRREVFERDPWVARGLYQAFDRSRVQWQEERRRLAETSPWLLADLEDTTELLGHDWQPYGVQRNRRMIQALCDEELAQGLIDQPLDPSRVFAEFEQVMNE